jgi:hypothetical protein
MANRIEQFFHCRRCMEEKPDDQSPRQWARIEAGWTDKGFQVWCVRHDINIADIDFMGQKVRMRQDDS